MAAFVLMAMSSDLSEPILCFYLLYKDAPNPSFVVSLVPDDGLTSTIASKLQ